MENNLLTDKAVKPDKAVLEAALGKSYALFAEFEEKAEELNLVELLQRWKVVALQGSAEEEKPLLAFDLEHGG